MGCYLVFTVFTPSCSEKGGKGEGVTLDPKNIDLEVHTSALQKWKYQNKAKEINFLFRSISGGSVSHCFGIEEEGGGGWTIKIHFFIHFLYVVGKTGPFMRPFFTFTKIINLVEWPTPLPPMRKFPSNLLFF